MAAQSVKRSRKSFSACPLNRYVLQALTALIACAAGLPSIADSFPAAAGDITIIPLIHSSVQLEYQGLVIQVDPWARMKLDQAKPADLIVITDSPGHHLDVEAIAALSKSNTRIVTAANGAKQVPEGNIMTIGERLLISGVSIEAIAAYDIILGAPAHPRGDANGYVLTIGGSRLYFAGVTECVDEVKALRNIDVAFMPMNVPLGRMTPAAAAACTKTLNPSVVYSYHYNQDWARRAVTPDYAGAELPGGISIAQSLDLFEQELSGSGIEVRRGDWYPTLD